MLVKTKGNSWKIYYREVVFNRKAREEFYDNVPLFESRDVNVYETVHRMESIENIWPLIVGETKPLEGRQLGGKIELGAITVEYQAYPNLIDHVPEGSRITKGHTSETSLKGAPIIKDLKWPAFGIDLAYGPEGRQDCIDTVDRKTIEKNLKAHSSNPFMNLEALAGCYFDTFPEASERFRERTILCILAPIYFRLQEIAISRKQITLKVRVDKELKKNISVAVMPTSVNGRTRQGLRLSGKDFRTTGHKDGDLLLQASCRFDEEISCLRLLPFIKDFLIPYSTDLLYSEPIPNLRAEVHQYWDPENQFLMKFLRDKGEDRANDFERGVSIALHVAGYQVEYLGQFKGYISRHRYGEVDIFAFAPEKNRIYAVECTLGPIEEKVAKVESHVARMRAQIKRCFITPIIATSLIQNEIPSTTLDKAGKKGILVLHRNLLIEMLERTQGNTRFVDFLENVARENHLKYIAR